MANFRLRIIQGTAKGSELPLTATKMSLGRESQNDLMIADSQLSRVHAHLVIQNDSILIKDNDSRNGVYVNNERVKEKLLRPGDQIGIGRSLATTRWGT